MNDLPATKLSGGLRDGTGEKPQRKIWHVSGYWWFVYPSDGATYLWRLEDSEWVRDAALFDAPVRADVEVFGDHVAVLGVQAGVGPLLLRLLKFDARSKRYRVLKDADDAVALPVGSHRVETATIAADGAGALFVGFVSRRRVYVLSATPPYTSWSPIETLFDGVSADDICALKSLPGGSLIAVWSDQNARRFSARVYDYTDRRWGQLEGYADQGRAIADDHLSCVADSDGNLYIAIKTSLNSKPPLIGLLRRSSGGVWSLTNVSLSGTRPVISLDPAAGKLYVVYSTRPGHDIVVQRGDAATGRFESRVTTLIPAEGGMRWNNPTVPERVTRLEDGTIFLVASCARDSILVATKSVNVEVL